jgi:hypothetical protein
MIIAATDRIFIQWGNQEIPLLDGNPAAFDDYAVYRSTGEDLIWVADTAADAYLDTELVSGTLYHYRVEGVVRGKDGKVLDTTIVFGPEHISTLVSSESNDIEPTVAPKDYTIMIGANEITHKWTAAVDWDSGMLGTFIEDRENGHAVAFIPDDGSVPVDSWVQPMKVVGEPFYRLRAIDRALNLSEVCYMKGLKKGWTVYRFGGSKSPFKFKLKKNCSLEADALIIGGGGSGGGGAFGGGGGAGGFIDVHNLKFVSDRSGKGSILIEKAHIHAADKKNKYHKPMPWDWNVIVGSGGKTVLGTDAQGNVGQPSSIGGTLANGKLVGDIGIIAYGGGYGGRVGRPERTATRGDEVFVYPEVVSYKASAGASGGGANPYDEIYYYFWGGRNTMYKGFGGKALNNWNGAVERICSQHDNPVYSEHGPLPPARRAPSAHWDSPDKPCGVGPPIGEIWSYTALKADIMVGALPPFQPQGHYGMDSLASAAWLNRTCGGGGGANWGGYTGGGGGIGSMADNAPNGGLGRPCDIEGYGPYYELMKKLADKGELGDLEPVKFVNWFCGGGAGKERPNNWSYPDGQAGYGGGGEVGSPGMVNTGGGGGGAGWYGQNTPGWGDPVDYYTEVAPLESNHPGPAGGRGVVIIRIPTSCEPLVAYPVPIGTQRKFVGRVVYEGIVLDEGREEDVPIYPSGIRVTHVPEDQPHIDVMGMEQVPIWDFPFGGWEDEDGNTWDAPVGGWDHYGWDGTWISDKFVWRRVTFPPPTDIVGKPPDDAGGRMDPRIPR